jgi:hypothetical protein
MGGVAAAWWISTTPDDKTDVIQAVSRDLVKESTLNENVGGGGETSQIQTEQASTATQANIRTKKQRERPKTAKPTIPAKPAVKPSPRVGYLGPPVTVSPRKPKS